MTSVSLKCYIKKSGKNSLRSGKTKVEEREEPMVRTFFDCKCSLCCLGVVFRKGGAGNFQYTTCRGCATLFEG